LTASLDFTDAYARYLPPVQAKCRRLLGCSSSAEDVAQETFLRWWQESGLEGTDTRQVMAWLYRTSTRLAIDVLRDRRRTTFGDDGVDEIPCAVDLAACAEARAAIRVLAHSSPREELAVAILCRVDGLPQPETAMVLGVSDRTVRRMLDRFDRRIESLRRESSL
jgi:RNA polymerase sigma-70 factor, ECF subfamily